jgi:hypothetical protein
MRTKILQATMLCFAASAAWFSTTPSHAQSAPTCSAKSAARVPTVIELYTSEGCSSCPPADRWLSQTIARQRSASNDAVPTVALAFHVDYWDYIGWKDAFAQPAFSKRQSALARSGGASGVYTPQVFFNGKDDRSWTRGASPPSLVSARANIAVSAQWRDESVAISGKLANLSTLAGEARLRYAITENGLITAVKAGENKGETLRHDAVVRAYGELSADGNGDFNANVRVPKTLRRDASQLHIIADDARGNPMAVATVACAG